MIDCRIVVVDNDMAVLKALRRVLSSEFRVVTTVSNPAVLPALLNEGNTDVVLLDMNFSSGKKNGEEGVFWLNRILACSVPPSVIVMTAFETISLAIRSFKHGAVDFVLKPWDNEALFLSVKEALKERERRKPSVPPEEPFPADIHEFSPSTSLSLEDMERQLIKHVLDKNARNLSVCADKLKITRQTLYNKIRKYEL